MFDAAAYRAQLAALLPQGAAWPREPDALLQKLLGGLAEELARVDGRAAAVIEESDPRTALELLTDWERVAGLPDGCVPVTGSVRERQLAVAAKIAGLGGQSRAFFIQLAASLGYSVEIEEFGPSRVGVRSGFRCFGSEWAHVWRMNIVPDDDDQLIVSSWFRVGVSRSGERIRSFGAGQLECLVNRAKPAHSIVIFAYPEEPQPLFWFDFLNP